MKRQRRMKSYSEKSGGNSCPELIGKGKRDAVFHTERIPEEKTDKEQMKKLDEVKKIDLHMHTLVSDGTDSPEEILEKVKDAGIDMFSVTDHDSIKASVVIREHLGDDDPLFISGVEFSCRDVFGKYHILGYNYDPNAGPVRALVSRGHDLRIEKLQKRLDILRERFNFLFSDEDIRALFANNNPGKPHIANLMVKYGFAKTKEDAFAQFLNQLKVASSYFHPKEAIDAIMLSGGIPILAHPSFGSGDELIIGDELEGRLTRLMLMGLKGVEGYYAGYSPKLQDEVLELAKKYDLYITAGSDYHGSNKFVKLGENQLADIRQAPEGLYRFLEAVTLRKAK